MVRQDGRNSVLLLYRRLRERSCVMYTSYDKINDRFGFNTGGTFRCAFRNTRAVLGTGMFIIAAVVILIIINLIYLFTVFDDKGSLGELVDINRLFELANYTAEKAPDDGVDELANYRDRIVSAIGEDPGSGEKEQHHLIEAFSTDLINFSTTVMATGFGLYLLMLLVIAFLIIMAVMRTGDTYKFKADEERFTVIYPPKIGGTLVMEYDYITGVTCQEWSFPFAPKCLDVTIQTKQGDFMFRCIHTPMSRANGICELPFNIIREKIGLSDETDVMLIHDRERRMKRGT